MLYVEGNTLLICHIISDLLIRDRAVKTRNVLKANCKWFIFLLLHPWGVAAVASSAILLPPASLIFVPVKGLENLPHKISVV